MKQKYVVRLDTEGKLLSIQEYAELDKDMLSLLCEETYSLEAIQAAMAKDRNALIQRLRTNNMYPPGVYIERIADAIVEMFQPGANPLAELLFEEREMFGGGEELVSEAEEETDEEGMDMDDLLDEEEIEDDFEDKGIIKNLKSTIQISDEDPTIDEA